MTVMTDEQLNKEHVGERPSWDCEACARPWPCADAKERLLIEFRGFPSVLTIYMSAQMCEAMLDLTAHGIDPPTDLYDRFLSWVHLASARNRGGKGTRRARPPRFQELRDREAARWPYNLG
jgi:hypothetical protein